MGGEDIDCPCCGNEVYEENGKYYNLGEGLYEDAIHVCPDGCGRLCKDCMYSRINNLTDSLCDYALSGKCGNGGKWKKLDKSCICCRYSHAYNNYMDCPSGTLGDGSCDKDYSKWEPYIKERKEESGMEDKELTKLKESLKQELRDIKKVKEEKEKKREEYKNLWLGRILATRAAVILLFCIYAIGSTMLAPPIEITSDHYEEVDVDSISMIGLDRFFIGYFDKGGIYNTMDVDINEEWFDIKIVNNCSVNVSLFKTHKYEQEWFLYGIWNYRSRISAGIDENGVDGNEGRTYEFLTLVIDREYYNIMLRGYIE